MPPVETLRALLARRRLSLSEAARRSGLSRYAVQQWCDGAVRPWPHKAQALADVLGVSLERILRAAAAGRRHP